MKNKYLPNQSIKEYSHVVFDFNQSVKDIRHVPKKKKKTLDGDE